MGLSAQKAHQHCGVIHIDMQSQQWHLQVGDDPMPNKHPDKLVQQAQRERHREQHKFLRPARTPLYKVHMVR